MFRVGIACGILLSMASGAALALSKPAQIERGGYLVIFDAESLAAAEALVHESPIRAAGLYSEFHLFEYQEEVG